MENINTRQWSTPIIIAAGLFVSVSGVLMFIGVRNPLELAHEWIGLIFFAAILLHVLNHWRSFKHYLSQRRAVGIVVVIVMLTSTLILSSANQGGGNVMMRMIHSFEGAPLTEVAPLLDQRTDALISKFEAAGFIVDNPQKSIAEIALANGAEPKALIHVLFD